MFMFITCTRTAISLPLLGETEGICITNKYFTVTDKKKIKQSKPVKRKVRLLKLSMLTDCRQKE